MDVRRSVQHVWVSKIMVPLTLERLTMLPRAVHWLAQ